MNFKDELQHLIQDILGDVDIKNANTICYPYSLLIKYKLLDNKEVRIYCFI